MGTDGSGMHWLQSTSREYLLREIAKTHDQLIGGLQQSGYRCEVRGKLTVHLRNA